MNRSGAGIFCIRFNNGREAKFAPPSLAAIRPDFVQTVSLPNAILLWRKQDRIWQHGADHERVNESLSPLEDQNVMFGGIPKANLKKRWTLGGRLRRIGVNSRKRQCQRAKAIAATQLRVLYPTGTLVAEHEAPRDSLSCGPLPDWESTKGDLVCGLSGHSEHLTRGVRRYRNLLKPKFRGS